MRIDRIRLRNFCGVTEAEVRFAPKGITIVHGPNEAGKSTLMHGINVLFDHKDDSKREEVRLTKPVHFDVGSEVEADFEIGSFQFTYFKRFHKDRETRLTIHAPKAENLTGREAHERVQQILSTSLDTNLWRALRIVQGQNLEMPELHSQPALTQALDHAAGQAKSGERDEGLYEAAHAEYLQYFTDKGKEKEDPIGRIRRQLDTAEKSEQDLMRQLKELEDDVIRFATLAKATDTLSRNLVNLESAEKRDQEAWNVVSKLSDNIDRCKTIHQLAVQTLASAKNAIQQRNQLVEAVQVASKKIEDAKTKENDSAKELESARVSLASVTRARDESRIALDRAENEEKLRRADHTFLIEEFELIRLKERLERINSAEAAGVTANNIIATTSVTEELRAIIRKSELKLETSRGILNTAAPQLRIKALQRASLVINGKDMALESGTECQMPIIESISARIGESADIYIDPGTSAETLKQNLVDAEQMLIEACHKAGVSTPQEAESAWFSLQDATRTIADRNRVIKEHLRDFTREKLESLVQTTQAKVSIYPEKRKASFPLPLSIENAQQLLDKAEKTAIKTKKDQQAAEEVLRQFTEHHAKLREGYAAKAALLEQVKSDYTQVTTRLQELRMESSDNDLATKLAKTENEFQESLDVLKTAEIDLGNSDPNITKAILDTSKSTYKRAYEQHATRERELLQLRTKLDLLGEQGLAEALTESQRAAFEVKDELTRLLRHALAAKCLFETLRSEREIMHKAYVAPLREGIERLGRHVFGASLSVDVNESLYVVSRTIDRRTVMLEQLSTGAREQIGLLVRLATASIIAKDGGVPLVLDDVLGSTDEARLGPMGAVIRIASEDSQTIILTCAPERYLHVGASAMVELS